MFFNSLWQYKLRSLLCVASATFFLAACGGSDDDAGIITPSDQPSQQFELSIQVTGAGEVQTVPAGLSCSSICSANVNASSVITLEATPANGFRFAGWGDSCSGTASCVVTMDQLRLVSAYFEPIPGVQNFTLTAAVTGSGIVTSQPAGINCGSDCSEAYPANALVTLTAIPNANQSFSGWTGSCAGASSCIVTMNQVNSVTATFMPITAGQFTLTASVTGNGRVTSNPVGIDCGVTCAVAFNANTSVTLTALPALGQVFNGWSGACSGSQLNCVLQLSQARSAQAAFVAAPPVAAVWQTALALESSNDFNIGSTNRFADANILTAIGSNGHAMVMWEQSDGVPDGNTTKAYSRRYDPATGWQAAVQVGTLTWSGFGLVQGYLLIDSSGVATWIRPNKETRRNSPTTGWGSVFSIPAVIPGSFDPGSLVTAVMADNGDIGVMLSGSDVYNNALPAGQQQWGTWARVDASGALSAFDARVALSGNGSALAVWLERNPGDSNNSVKAARYSPSTGWNAPESIESLFTNAESASLRIAIDSQGNGIAMWKQGNSMYYNLYRVGSGWQGEVEFDAGQAASSARTQLAMTPDGRAVAVWNTGLAAVRSMQYSAATGWTNPVTVDSYGLELQLAITDAGLATLVYNPPINATTANFEIASRTVNFGGQWSAVTLLENGAGNVKSRKFSMNRSGQGVAAWSQDDIVNSTVRNSLWGAVLR